jgi:glycosyltransferase involved in cell wall biosynthesis
VPPTRDGPDLSQPKKEPPPVTDAATSGKLPFISVVLPVRNEADFIEKCLRSLMANDYARGRIEMLVVDGMSDDGTREIVQRLAAEDERVRLLDNLQGIVPCAMNMGIRESKGDIIIRVDGHVTVAPDFISQSVRALNEHPEVWCAGGVMETVGTTYIGRVIAAAASSPFGVGGASFRTGDTEGYVNAVPFGAHRRWIFDKIGMYDEELVRNQDDELILRIVEAGGKQYRCPSIRSVYYPRHSLRKLARQYYQYGFWRIRTIQKHGRVASLRQFVPLAFVLAWAALLVTSVLWAPALLATAGLAGLYLLLLVAGAAESARRRGITVGLLVPVAIAVMHFAYGFGCWKGVWSWVVLRGRFVPKGATHKLSR